MIRELLDVTVVTSVLGRVRGEFGLDVFNVAGHAVQGGVYAADIALDIGNIAP